MDSLRDTITAAVNGSSEAPAPDAPASSPAPAPSAPAVSSPPSPFDTPEIQAQRARDEAGRFAKEKAAKEGKEAAQAASMVKNAAEPPAGAPAARKAHVAWEKSIGAEWDKLPKTVQDAIYQREDQVSGLAAKYGEAAKFAGAVQQIVAPYEPMLRQFNVTPPQAIQYLFNAYYTMKMGSPAQKQQMMDQLAAEIGLPPPSGAPPGERPAVDPNIQYLIEQQQRIDRTLGEQISRQQYEEEQRQHGQQRQIHQTIEQFASDAKNKHFEAVREPMARLLQSGMAQTLEDAYDQACWANASVRSSLLAERTQENAGKLQAQAAEARRSVTPSGAPSTSANGAAAPTGNLRDLISSQVYGSA